jgi:hypothetical protein
MEAQVQLSHVSVEPPETDWPAVPNEPFKVHGGVNGSRLDVVKPPLEESPDSRNTDGLSMDDIAAAQALEGLRAGNESLNRG